VYRVRHVEYGDICALKILKKESLDANEMSRFHREMEIGRDMNHPAVVRTFAFGDVRGAPYLVMEYLEGQTLEQRIGRGAMTVDDTLRIIDELCGGLMHAHQRGIIHRDLKPANVMLCASGRVCLLDFGIARCLDMKKLTVTGVPLGTPAYMSPEHARSKVDVRSDVYSLGVIFFEMLTGRLPFEAADAIAMMMAHVSGRVPSLCGLAPQVSAEVEAVVLKMLAKKPAQRYQTVQEVQDAVAALRSSVAES